MIHNKEENWIKLNKVIIDTLEICLFGVLTHSISRFLSHSLFSLFFNYLITFFFFLFLSGVFIIFNGFYFKFTRFSNIRRSRNRNGRILEQFYGFKR